MKRPYEAHVRLIELFAENGEERAFRSAEALDECRDDSGQMCKKSENECDRGWKEYEEEPLVRDTSES